ADGGVAVVVGFGAGAPVAARGGGDGDGDGDGDGSSGSSARGRLIAPAGAETFGSAELAGGASGRVGGSACFESCADRNVCESTVSRRWECPGVTGSRPGLTVSDNCTETRTPPIQSSCSRISWLSSSSRARLCDSALKAGLPASRYLCPRRSTTVTASAVRPGS